MEQKNIHDYMTLLLIETDCSTIIKLLAQIKNPLLNLMSLSYMALFCNEATAYLNIDSEDLPMIEDIRDIRNALKIYSNRFTKSRKHFLAIDNAQDEEFKGMLRFKFMQQWNVHYNMGVYFTEQGDIVGNTQLIADVLSLNGLNKENSQKRCFDLGNAMGNIVGEIHAFFVKAAFSSNIAINTATPQIYYMDVNTNRKRGIFPNNFSKDINIFILHMLSCIGFVNNFLATMLPDDNYWLFRIRYIVTYYTLLGIEKLNSQIKKKHGSQNTFVQQSQALIDQRPNLFKSSFRNCMMHYDLCQNGNEIINQEYYDLQKPFYGLVESCFDGISFFEYKEKLLLFTNDLEKLLRNEMNIDINKLKPL